MKPVFDELGADDPQDPTDVSVYHDVFMFKEVYRSGVEKPYSPQMFGSHNDFEEHFRVLMQRALLSMHAFIPDRSDAEGRLDRLFKLRQDYYVQIRRYVKAFYNPDAEKYQKCIVEANFYAPSDDLIRYARAVQQGAELPGDAVSEALAKGSEVSKYAEALARGVGYLMAANRYFLRLISMEQARTAWHIGIPDH